SPQLSDQPDELRGGGEQLSGARADRAVHLRAARGARIHRADRPALSVLRDHAHCAHDRGLRQLLRAQTVSAPRVPGSLRACRGASRQQWSAEGARMSVRGIPAPRLYTPSLYWEDRARRFAKQGYGLAAVCSYGMPEFYNRAIHLEQYLALRR